MNTGNGSKCSFFFPLQGNFLWNDTFVVGLGASTTGHTHFLPQLTHTLGFKPQSLQSDFYLCLLLQRKLRNEATIPAATSCLSQPVLFCVPGASTQLSKPSACFSSFPPSAPLLCHLLFPLLPLSALTSYSLIRFILYPSGPILVICLLFLQICTISLFFSNTQVSLCYCIKIGKSFLSFLFYFLNTVWQYLKKTPS